MNAPKPDPNSFTSNWLPWLALYHLLPVANLREVACGMVGAMSHGELTIHDLVEESLTGTDAVSERWSIEPKQISTPLGSYLLARIRALIWNNDASAHFDPQGDWSGLPVHPSVVEAVVMFGYRPDSEPLKQLSGEHSLDEYPELSVLTRCFEALVDRSNAERTTQIVDAIDSSAAQLQMPFRAVALKFFGDCAALQDQWGEASELYTRVLTLLATAEKEAWSDLRLRLTTVTVQSLAAASRTLEGNDAAAHVFDTAIRSLPEFDSALFRANASRDNFALRVNPSSWLFDGTTVSARAPFLIESHNIERPMIEALESDFSQAHKKFQARLRRQIALGSISEVRVTKGAFARSIFSYLTEMHKTKRDRSAFSVATHFLIDCEKPKLASNIHWSRELVETYVDNEMIELVRLRSTAYDGVRKERQILAVVLLSSWAMKLPSESSEVGGSILRLLAQFAKDNLATSNSSNDVCGDSLKALKKIGDRQPEWRSLASKPVAQAVLERLKEPGWWTGRQDAAETAIAYEESFEEIDLESITYAAVDVLEQVDPSFWPVVRPLQVLLVSPRTGLAIRNNRQLERRVVELLLRNGIEQESEHASLMYYLRAFDASLLEDSELRVRLQEIVKSIETKARMVNSSASLGNIQALLSVPTISGLSGVRTALGSLDEILKSADRNTISLPMAYSSLMQIANEHNEIAAGVGIPDSEFLEMLMPVIGPLQNLWARAAESPQLFVPFSIPRNEVPNLVLVHNWTFASLYFARLLGEEAAIADAIDAAAKAQPTIAKAVARAKAIQALASDDVDFDETSVSTDPREVFYLKLGVRISQLDIATDERERRCQLLMRMCLQHGPNDLDMAIFVKAAQCGLSLEQAHSTNLTTYVKRLRASQDRYLNFLPLLKQLGYRHELEKYS